MATLALVYIGIGFMQDHPGGPMTESTLAAADLTITLAFLAEFSLRFYAAPSRRRYLRGHWIDLLALLPAIRWLRFLRLTRLVYIAELARLLRLGVLVRFLVQLNRVGNQIRAMAVRNGVHVFLTLAAGLVVIGGTLVWELEHTINPAFHSYADAIWWAFATMTTVGFGNGPVTPAGRVVAAFVMITGIACFGVITATVTALFLHEPSPDQAATPEALMAALEDIRARLTQLEHPRARGASADPAEHPAPNEGQRTTITYL